MISYGRHNINNNDIASVIKVLKSDFLTQGHCARKFEEALAEYCGAKYAVAVSNGTAALHLSCLALGLKKGDYHWTSPVSFAASANCGIYCGSTPDFVDINLNDFNISNDELKKKLSEAEKQKKLPKIIIPVHFAGLPCDMPGLKQLSEKYNFKIVEDACHALGAGYKFKNKWYKIGCCKHSDICVFSFHPVKSITTGEGGAILTNNRELYEKLLMLRSHGITKDSLKFLNPSIRQSVNPIIRQSEDLCDVRCAMCDEQSANPSIPPWYYEMQELGFNYRITDIQCALGLSQLKRIESFINKREEIRRIYASELDEICNFQTYNLSTKKSANHLFVILISDRNGLYEFLNKNGVQCQIHYIPIYRHPFYKKNYKLKNYNDFVDSEKYYDKCISLPIYFDLKISEVKKICGLIKKFIKINQGVENA